MVDPAEVCGLGLPRQSSPFVGSLPPFRVRTCTSHCSAGPGLFWLAYHSLPFPLFSFVEPGADTVFLDCLGSLELDFRLVISPRDRLSPEDKAQH